MRVGIALNDPQAGVAFAKSREEFDDRDFLRANKELVFGYGGQRLV